MGTDVQTPHTGVHQAARRFLEPIQDLLVLGIAVVLFGIMVRTLGGLVRELFLPGLDFRVVIGEVLFMLVMVEVVRLLIVYLQEHRIAVDFMVELGIVATLREAILIGVTELDWRQLLALTAFLAVLGSLLRFGDLRPLISFRARTFGHERSGGEPRPSPPPVGAVANPAPSRDSSTWR